MSSFSDKTFAAIKSVKNPGSWIEFTILHNSFEKLGNIIPNKKFLVNIIIAVAGKNNTISSNIENRLKVLENEFENLDTLLLNDHAKFSEKKR